MAWGSPLSAKEGAGQSGESAERGEDSGREEGRWEPFGNSQQDPATVWMWRERRHLR